MLKSLINFSKSVLLQFLPILYFLYEFLLHLAYEMIFFFYQLIIFQYQTSFQEASMYQRSSQPLYSKVNPQESESFALRAKAFSHLDNISHQTSHQISVNATNTDDKVSEIKKKYEKTFNLNNKKNNGENFNSNISPINFGKTVSTYEAYDENSRWSPYKQPLQTENRVNRSSNQRDSLNIPQGRPLLQRNYQKSQIKSQLENNRATLSTMKNELQTKLSDLSSKAEQISPSIKDPYQEIRGKKQMPQSNTYESILSKYSKNNQYRQVNEGNDAERYSNYRSKYDVLGHDKNDHQLKNKQASLSYHEKCSSVNKSIIFANDKTTKHQLSTITQTNSNHSDFQKQTNYDFRKNQIQTYKAQYGMADKTGDSAIINDRKYMYENTYNNQRTTLSYIDDKKNKTKEEPRTNLEFTLQRQERPQTSFNQSKPQEDTYHYNKSSLTSNKTPSKYNFGMESTNLNQTASTFKYDINNQKYSNHNKSCGLDKSSKGETRNSEAISREIEKLDQKIKQIEQNKMELNINFSPYSASKSANKTSTIQSKNHNISISKYEKEELSAKYAKAPTPTDVSINIDRNRYSYSIRHQDIPRATQNYNQRYFPETTKNEQKQFIIPYTPAESNKDDEQLTQRSNADLSFQSRVNNYMNKKEVEKSSDYGIEERKKQMQSRVQVNNTIKGLVKALGEQVSLDEAFRNNKIWFASEHQDKKWVNLKNQLQRNGVSISQNVLKQTFCLEESQHNPFFSVSDAKCNIKSLAQSYQQAQKHWDQKVSHKFSKIQLEKEGLNSYKIDYDRKGFIEVQDLVRFLNIESGTFFRNRDLSVIFKRIKNGSQMQFSEFMEAVSA